MSDMPTTVDALTLTTAEVVKASGATERQLRLAATLGLLNPDRCPGGSGCYWTWNTTEAARAARAAWLATHLGVDYTAPCVWRGVDLDDDTLMHIVAHIGTPPATPPEVDPVTAWIKAAARRATVRIVDPTRPPRVGTLLTYPSVKAPGMSGRKPGATTGRAARVRLASGAIINVDPGHLELVQS